MGARLENVKDLILRPDSNWWFKTKCDHCKEVHDKIICFKLTDVQQLPGSAGTATYVAKCKFCERVSNIEYCKDSLRPYNGVKSDEEESKDNDVEIDQLIASFECRGIELIEFHLGNEWGCVGAKSGTEFGQAHGEEAIEFDQGDWCGYDE